MAYGIKGTKSGVRAGSNVAALGQRIAQIQAARRSRDMAASPEIALQMVNSSDDARAALQKYYQSLDNAGKKAFLERVATEFPAARGTGLSVEADRVMRVASGRGLSPEELASIDAASTGKGKTTIREDIGGEAVREEANPTDEFVNIDDPEGVNYDAPEELKAPGPVMRKGLPEGYDPKEARVKDPSFSTSKVQEQPRLRGPKKEAKLTRLPDGKRAVVYETSDDGTFGTQDFAAKKRGEEYERAVSDNVAFQRNMLLELFGDNAGIATAIRQAEDGDGAIAAQLKAVRNMADKAHPIPAKPYGVSPQIARASERSPLNDYNDNVRSLGFGKPGAMYRPVSGSRDQIENIAQEILIGANPRYPLADFQKRFKSPEEAAAAIVRNSSPEMFDATPITPNQRRDADDLLRQIQPQYANQMLEAFYPDLPYRQADKQGLMTQVEERIAQELRGRFGDQWGENYKPGPVSDLEAAPHSRVPDPAPGTSQDLGAIPQEGVRDFWSMPRGRENVRGEQPVRTPGRDYSQPPTQEGLDIDDPDLAEITQQSIDAYEFFKQRDDAKIQKLDAMARAGQFPIRSGFREDIPEPKIPRTYNQLSAQEQWESGYGRKKKNRAWEDSLAGYNNLNRQITEEDQARRAAKADELAGTIDNLEKTPAAEIRQDIQKVERWMQTHGMTPEVAARGEAELARLKAKLQRAINLDQMSGIASAKQPGPLSGKVNQVQGKPVDPNDLLMEDANDRTYQSQGVKLGQPDGSVVDTTPTRKPAVDPMVQGKALAERAAADFTNPRLGDKRRAKAMETYQKLQQQGESLPENQRQAWDDQVLKPMRDAIESSMKPKGGKKAGGNAAPKPEAAAPKADVTPPKTEATAPKDPVEDQIDPLESAATEIDPPADPPKDPTDPAPGRNTEEPPRKVEQEAAAAADAKKANEDAESTRPTEESSTIPPKKNEKTPDDKPKRSMISRGLGLGALGALGVGGWAVMQGLNKREAPSMDEAWGTPADEEGRPTAVMADESGVGVTAGSGSGTDSGVPANSADRIRAMQNMQRTGNSYGIRRNTQNAIHWSQ